VSDNDSAKKESTIDLGLSQLIETAQVVTAPPIASPSESPTPEANNSTAAVAAVDTIIELKDEYTLLSEEGAWTRIAALCDERSLGEEDPYIRLWWIHAQLEIGEVPLSILAAPLDSLSRALADDVKRLKRLVDNDSAILERLEQMRPLCHKAAMLLRRLGIAFLPGAESQDPPLATTFFERAFRLDGKQGESALDAVERERAALVASQEIPSELDRAVRLTDLKNIEEDLKQSGVQKSQQETITLHAIEDPQDKDTERSSDKLQSTEAKQNVQQATQKNTRFRLSVIAASVLVLVTVLWFLPSLLEDPAVELPVAKLSPEAPGHVLTPLKRVDGVSTLDSVMYQVTTRPSPLATPYEGAAMPQAAPQQQPAAQPKRPLDIVDTSGPIERSIPPPEDDSDRSSVAPADWGMSRGGPISGDRTMRPLPTPSLDETRSRAPGEQFIERYKNGKEFKILVRTKVLESPSFRAEAVTTLFPGDIILVEERIGDWLKVRSKRGSPGYVMYQDAEPRS
jgi:hypothetical protein